MCQAGISPDVDFATKPELAKRLLERLLAHHGGAALPWFAADEAYGDNPGLRDWLDNQDINDVMAVSCDARFAIPTGPCRADELATSAPKRGWQRLSCGQAAKATGFMTGYSSTPAPMSISCWVRRSISKPTELAYYICHSRTPVPPRRTGPRRRIPLVRRGTSIQFAKNETDLDH